MTSEEPKPLQPAATPRELSAEEASFSVPATELAFETTADVSITPEWLGQERALAADGRDEVVLRDLHGGGLRLDVGVEAGLETVAQGDDAIALQHGVVQVVRDVWTYTKRKTNVVLVVDTSGSMQVEQCSCRLPSPARSRSVGSSPAPYGRCEQGQAHCL